VRASAALARLSLKAQHQAHLLDGLAWQCTCWNQFGHAAALLLPSVLAVLLCRLLLNARLGARPHNMWQLITPADYYMPSSTCAHVIATHIKLTGRNTTVV
jgi:hypothetical protein